MSDNITIKKQYIYSSFGRSGYQSIGPGLTSQEIQKLQRISTDFGQYPLKELNLNASSFAFISDLGQYMFHRVFTRENDDRGRRGVLCHYIVLLSSEELSSLPGSPFPILEAITEHGKKAASYQTPCLESTIEITVSKPSTKTSEELDPPLMLAIENLLSDKKVILQNFPDPEQSIQQIFKAFPPSARSDLSFQLNSCGEKDLLFPLMTFHKSVLSKILTRFPENELNYNQEVPPPSKVFTKLLLDKNFGSSLAEDLEGFAQKIDVFLTLKSIEDVSILFFVKKNKKIKDEEELKLTLRALESLKPSAHISDYILLILTKAFIDQEKENLETLKNTFSLLAEFSHFSFLQEMLEYLLNEKDLTPKTKKVLLVQLYFLSSRFSDLIPLLNEVVKKLESKPGQESYRKEMISEAIKKMKWQERNKFFSKVIKTTNDYAFKRDVLLLCEDDFFVFLFFEAYGIDSLSSLFVLQQNSNLSEEKVLARRLLHKIKNNRSLKKEFLTFLQGESSSGNEKEKSSTGLSITNRFSIKNFRNSKFVGAFILGIILLTFFLFQSDKAAPIFSSEEILTSQENHKLFLCLDTSSQGLKLFPIDITPKKLKNIKGKKITPPKDLDQKSPQLLGKLGNESIYKVFSHFPEGWILQRGDSYYSVSDQNLTPVMHMVKETKSHE